jgi:hypothetical protein
MKVADYLYAAAPAHLVNAARLESYQKLCELRSSLPENNCACGEPAEKGGKCMECWWTSMGRPDETKLLPVLVSLPSPVLPAAATTTVADWLKEKGIPFELVGGDPVVGKLRVSLVDLKSEAGLASLTKGLKPDENRMYLFSNEWEDRSEQCQAFLLARSGKFTRRIGARKCEVCELRRADAAAFVDAYHIQGSNNLNVTSFGLIYKGELVGLMSLGRHSRQISENRIVMDRLCFKSGVQVVGGATRLLKHCADWARDVNYDEIVTFSDNRWTDGSLYAELGFSLDNSYRPDYFYVKDGARFSKQGQKKSTSHCPAGMTEFEWAKQRGLIRCYDAGKKRWLLNLRPESHETRQELNSKQAALAHQNGAFKHHHIRGYFVSNKNKSSIYYSSSYELRCMYILEIDDYVSSFKRCDSFKGSNGWRNPDLLVTFDDGLVEVWEIKPEEFLGTPPVVDQLSESAKFAASIGATLRVWTEKDSGLASPTAISEWARKYLATITGDTSHAEKKAASRKAIRDRYKAKHADEAHVTTFCEYCKEEHVVLRHSYTKNVERNGKYICERYGGYLAGSRPKDHLKSANPYAEEGRKKCSGCMEVKDLELFDVRRASWDGRNSRCKECISAKNAAMYKERMTAKEQTCH